MGRVYKRKKDYGQTSSQIMEQAIGMVSDGKSIRETANTFNISKSTLQRYVKKHNSEDTQFIPSFTPNYSHSKVFKDAEEKEIGEYLITVSKYHYGLTTTQTRELAYQFAMKINANVPASWTHHQRAGVDWLRGFLSRNPTLSLRSPEATSLARGTSFNHKNVGDFYDNLQNVMARYNFRACDIFNVDETGLCTVMAPPKVIALRVPNKLGKLRQPREDQQLQCVVLLIA